MPKDKSSDLKLYNDLPKDKSSDLKLYNDLPKDKSSDLKLYNDLPKDKSSDLKLYNDLSKDKSSDLKLYNDLPKDKSSDLKLYNDLPKDKSSDLKLYNDLPKDTYTWSHLIHFVPVYKMFIIKDYYILSYDPYIKLLQQRGLLKTSVEKKKMLVPEVSSCSHNIFYPFKNRNHTLQKKINLILPKLCCFVELTL